MIPKHGFRNFFSLKLWYNGPAFEFIVLQTLFWRSAVESNLCCFVGCFGIQLAGSEDFFDWSDWSGNLQKDNRKFIYCQFVIVTNHIFDFFRKFISTNWRSSAPPIIMDGVQTHNNTCSHLYNSWLRHHKQFKPHWKSELESLPSQRGGGWQHGFRTWR